MLQREISYDEVQDRCLIRSCGSSDRSGGRPEFKAPLIFGQVGLRSAYDRDQATDSEIGNAISSQGSGCDTEGCGKHVESDRTTRASGAAKQPSAKLQERERVTRQGPSKVGCL